MQPNACRVETASRVHKLSPSVERFEFFETNFSSGKKFIPTLGDSANSGISVLDSSTTLHSSLNPLVLPFVSNLCNEDCQNYCDLRAMGTTPIFNSISTPDLSLRNEVLGRHFQGNHKFQCDSNGSESEDVLGSEDVLDITPIVFDSETPNLSMSEETYNSLSTVPLSGNAVHTADTDADTMSVISINDNDEPKKLLQTIKAKNSERPIIAHININFLNPKFEPLKDKS